MVPKGLDKQKRETLYTTKPKAKIKFFWRSLSPYVIAKFFWVEGGGKFLGWAFFIVEALKTAKKPLKPIETVKKPQKTIKFLKKVGVKNILYPPLDNVWLSPSKASGEVTHVIRMYNGHPRTFFLPEKKLIFCPPA